MYALMFPVNLWLFKDRADANKTIRDISERSKALAVQEFGRFFLNRL
jgi:hypothetical protein